MSTNNSKDAIFFKIRKEVKRLSENKKCKVAINTESDGFTVVMLLRDVLVDNETSTTLQETFTLASGFPQEVYRRLYIINRAIEF